MIRRLVTSTTARFSVLVAFLLAGASCGGDESTGNSAFASLRFITQPTTVAAGASFTVTVELLNSEGVRATGSRASVLLRLTSGAALQGTTTVDAVSGVATFDDLSVTTAATNLQLQAEAATFNATSSAFAVDAGAATGAQSTAAAPSTPLSPYAATEITFTFKDGFGNVLRQATVAVSSSQAGSTLTPTSGTTGTDGTFKSSFLPSGEGSVTFSATVAGTAITLAAPLAITDPCPPAAMTFPGVTQGSVPNGVCAVEGRPAAAYRFTVAAAGGIAFAVSSAFPPLVEVMTDPPGTNVKIQPAADNQSVEWILPAGTFRFRVASLANPGAFSVTGSTVAANTGQIPRVLVTGGTYTGQTITNMDFPYGDGTFFDLFYLFSSRACTITMRSTAFDTWLELASTSDGMSFASDNDTGGGTDSQITLPRCADATGNPIFVVANNFNPASTGGAYTLTVALTGPGLLRAASVGDNPVLRRETTIRVPADVRNTVFLGRKPR